MDLASAGSRLDGATCLVCFGKATGVHYGVVACEGCKAFYKRCLTNALDFKCFFGGNCTVEPATDTRCRSCRYQRCIQVGMKLEAAKRGRRPKPKEVREILVNKQPVNRDAITIQTIEHQIHKVFRKIAPSPDPTHVNGVNLAVSVANESVDSSTARVSVIRNIPLDAGRFSREVQPYVRPPLTALSVSSGTSEPEPAEIHQPLVDLNGSHRLTNHLTRLSPTTVFNLHGFYVDSRSFECPLHRMPPEYTPEAFTGDSISRMPGFLGEYYDGLKEERMFREGTVRVLIEAINKVYGEDFARFDDLIQHALLHGLPQEPRCDPDVIFSHLREGHLQLLLKACQFFTPLRGFSDLGPDDQRLVIKDCALETFLVVYHNYIRNGELFYTVGPVQFTAYWAGKFFAPDYLSASLGMMDEFKRLRLSRTEAFLFLAVAAFNPALTTARDKKTLSFLHAHYLDCLLQSIRSRQTISDSAKTIVKLTKFLTKSRAMYRISIYIHAVDWSRYPLVGYKDGGLFTIARAMTLEDDGLDGPFIAPVDVGEEATLA